MIEVTGAQLGYFSLGLGVVVFAFCFGLVVSLIR